VPGESAPHNDYDRSMRAPHRRQRAGKLAGTELRRRLGIDEAGRRLLLWFVVPTWIGAGLADWWCHRRSDIEHTAGTHESLVHAVQMTEGGVPALLGLLCEVNAGVLAITLTNLVLHQATAAWDVAYAEDRREVTPTEQHVHGMLEQVPVMATALLLALHWDQARALVGRGVGKRDLRLRRKQRPLSGGQLGGLFAAVLAFVIVPYAEELTRCYRVRASAELLTPSPAEDS